jgi:hypothetical protein
MTLPRLLTQAVKAQTGQDNARYVFALGRWLLEGVEDHQSLILTLATVDGFEVSFRIPHATCRALGWSLQHDSDDDTADLGDPRGASLPNRGTPMVRATISPIRPHHSVGRVKPIHLPGLMSFACFLFSRGLRLPSVQPFFKSSNRERDKLTRLHLDRAAARK